MIEQAFLSMYAAFAVLFGLVFGSFTNVLIARLPRDESLLAPSHCPRCGHHVRWVDLTPVLAWVWLRGKCRDCGSAIAPTYPAIELLGGLLGYLLFIRIFPEFEDLALPNVLAFIVYGAFIVALITAFFVDLRHQIIPDPTSSWMIPVGIGGTIVLWLTDFSAFPAVSWEQSILGAVLGASFLALIAVGYRLLTGSDGLGFGDAKLLGMVGAFVGALPGVWVVLLLASLIGVSVHLVVLAIRRRSGFVPFGPSIVTAALLYLFYGDWIVPLILPGIAELTGMPAP